MIIVCVIAGIAAYFMTKLFEFVMWHIGHFLWELGIRPRLNRYR